MVAVGHVAPEVQGGEGLRGWVAAAEGDKGGWGHGLNRPQPASRGTCEKEGRCVLVHIHLCVGMCVDVWAFQNCEGIQGLQEMEGMRI